MPALPTPGERMKHVIPLPTALVILLALAPAPVVSAQGDGGDKVQGAESDAAGGRKQRELSPGRGPAVGLPQPAAPETRARNLVKDWETATYFVLKNGEEFGVYTQRNAMASAGSETRIEFRDHLAIPKLQYELRFQSIHRLDPDVTLASVVGTLADAQMSVRFEDGHAKGKGMGQSKIDHDLASEFLTRFSVLRALNDLPQKMYEDRRYNFVALDDYPARTSVKTVIVRCLGKDNVTLGGREVPAWKYRWTEEGEQNSHLWYGSSGQLLKLTKGREEWVLSPNDAQKLGKQDATSKRPAKKKSRPAKRD